MHIAALLAWLDVRGTRFRHRLLDRIQAPTGLDGVRQDPFNVADDGRG
jgi:hypothetical protein